MKYILLFLLLFTAQVRAEETKLSNATAETVKIFNSSVVSIVEGLKSTKDFAVKEVPAVVTEYLKWNFIKSILYASLNFLILISLLVIYIVTFKKFVKEDHDYFIRTMLSIIFIFIAIAPFLTFIFNLETALQIYYAPKIYLIENLIKLVK